MALWSLAVSVPLRTAYGFDRLCLGLQTMSAFASVLIGGSLIDQNVIYAAG